MKGSPDRVGPGEVMSRGHLQTAESASITGLLATLSEPVRLRLLRVLEGDELTVGELAQVLQIPQSTVSRHLKHLAQAGWLVRRQERTATLYRLVLDELRPDARSLWATVRNEVDKSPTPEFDEDARRVRSVLAQRMTDSATFFGRVAGEWDELRQALFGSGFTRAALLGLLNPEWEVADLGCGTGNAAEHLAPWVRRVVAVDRSEPMLEAARKRLAGVSNVEFVAGELEELPLGDASVDAAVCALVLHHVEEPGRVLGEMRRVLRPGGAALVIDMGEHDRDEYKRTMGHRKLGFGEAEMTGLLIEAGFGRAAVRHLRPNAEALGPGLIAATGWVLG